jgi:S1-C subfamily serine protease
VETEFYEQAMSPENGGAVPAEQFAIPVARVNRALWSLLRHPRRVVYVPGWLSISRLLEPLFGNLIDPLGPLLLRRK